MVASGLVPVVYNRGSLKNMADLEDIKQKVDLVALVSEYVALKKTGANFKGICPFHSEKTPSFVVSPERQIWHCFGGCQEGGDIFKFLMKMENIEFSEALKILAKRAGVKLVTSYPVSKAGEIKERIYEINHLAAEFYNYILTVHPMGEKARDYLDGRKISDNSIKLFSLGYAPNSWDSLTKFLTKRGYGQEDMFKAGLVSRSGIGNIFDRFRGRLIFTLKDHRGNVVGFAGRLLDAQAKEAKYVNTAETPVYVKGEILYGLEISKEAIKKEGFAVVVEGEIDAIQSYQAGVRNVVAIKGSALTEKQVLLLKRYTENVYLSLDADYAGDAAAHRGISIADQAGMNIKVVTFSGGKDPDELILKMGAASWHEAVKKAVNFYDFIIDSALFKYDVSKVEEAKKVVVEVAKFLAPIDNLVVKDHFIKKLAGKLNMPTSDLETQIGREFKKGQVTVTADMTQAREEAKANKSRDELLEEYLISLLLQCPNPADYLLLTNIRLKSEDFINPALGKIYQLLLSLADNPKSDVALPGEKFDINIMAKFIPSELMDIFNRLYLMENPVNIDSQVEVLREIQKTVWEIKEMTIRDRLKKISAEFKQDADNETLEKEFTETVGALQKLLEQKALVHQERSVN